MAKQVKNTNIYGVEERGLTKGRAEGAKNKAKEVAKKMKEEKIETSIIVKVTGLTKEEIEKLQ